MQSPLSLFAITCNEIFIEEIEKLIQSEQEISLLGYSQNIKPDLTYINQNAIVKRNCVTFIDAASVESKNIIKHFQTLNTIHRAKTLVYTNSVNSRFLNKLWESNVNGKLHNRETPLRNYFKANRSSLKLEQQLYLKNQRSVC